MVWALLLLKMLSRLLSKADSQAINVVDPAFYAPIDSKLQNPPSPGKHLAFDHHLSGAPNENIVENHLNIALLNVF